MPMIDVYAAEGTFSNTGADIVAAARRELAGK